MSRGRKASPPQRQSDRRENNATVEAKRSRAVLTDDDGRELSVEKREMSAWMGALPHPSHLERFDTIIPNGAERIMQLTEKEQAHRIRMEEESLPQNFQALKRGQYFGAFISTVALLSAAGTAYFGAHPAVSVALVGVPVLAVARASLERFTSRQD